MPERLSPLSDGFTILVRISPDLWRVPVSALDTKIGRRDLNLVRLVRDASDVSQNRGWPWHLVTATWRSDHPSTIRL